ncbi:MAG: heme o synthase [Deltaproteobacteria bacterium]|nr:heme o synthase [Deltaproteobacteria bacterium]
MRIEIGVVQAAPSIPQSASGSPPPAAASAAERVRAFADLTKPRLLPMVLFTGIPVFGMAAGGWPPLGFAAATLLGIALAAASANTLNAYLERDRDARMERTRNRPLPAGRLSPRAALAFGLLLGALSTGLLLALAGPAAAAVGVASILFYVFVYTIWLKPRSPWNVVIGGAAGAAAPLIADVAVHGTVTAAGLCLFAIVFFWQPPHVWAIALYRRRDYEAAGIPMLPSVIGEEATRRRMLAYAVGLVPVTLGPWALGFAGPFYLAVALGANAWFVASIVRLLRARDDAAAQRVFRVSLVLLFALFLALNVDLLARL